MKTPLLLAAFLAFSLGAKAVDTTPPTLNITHTWIEKVGTVVHFKMLLDPQDETGFSPLVGPPPGNTPGRTIEFRSKLNSTAALPANTPWNAFPYPWIRGEPFDVPFNCTSVVFELRAVDAAGNVSPLQRRTFASPFPFSPPPNLRPQVIPGEVQRAGSAANVRGLFVGRFDGVGISDDLVQVDRATGNIMVRRQINGQPVQSDVSFSLPADTIEDSASADFDTDSRADLAIIASGALTVYHNDGLDGDGVVQFGAQTVSLAGTGITTFNNIAVGDVTGDGKLDIVVSGTDSGGAPRIGWLIANATWQYDSSSGAPAPSGTTPGKLALGDMNGDGTLDVVMVDSANNQMIVFKNKGAGVIAGDGETDVNYQPVLIPTGLGQAGPDPTIPLIAASVRALTVGDVTGDGRPDILTVFSEILFTNPLDSNDGRTQQRWRLYENRGASGIRPHTDVLLGQSPASQTVLEDIPSDVMLMELNNDRFPEILFTNYYNNSVRIIRFTALLDHQNFLTTLDDGSGNPELDEQEYVPVVSTGPTLVGPSRLAKGKLYTNASVNSIAMSFAGSNAVRWELNATRTTTKPHDIIGGATTDSDASGVAGSNGTYSYTEYPGGGITYSLTYVNNTATALTGVTLESALPADFFLQSNDEGGVVSGTGASRVIRWTLDVPENSAGVKSFRVNLIATTKVASFAPKIILKQGAKILVTSAMPLVKLGTTNFTVVPNSPGQPWLFTYKPTVLPENAVAAVQTSPDGVNWTLIFSNNMTQVPGTIPVCTLSASDVPTTSRYFRALTWSNTTGYKYSSVFNNFLPPTTGLSLSSKSPAKSGQLWTFSATQSSTAGNVGVRFQSTTTPENGTSWSDLPIYTPTIRSGNVWTSKTYNIPTGALHFRAISSAPGWVDSISASSGPWNVIASPLSLLPFSYFHIDFVDPARNGNPATFYATTPSVTGLKVRFQSKLSSEDDSAWTDLTNGTLTQSGTKWTYKTNAMPSGIRDFRAISSALAYNDNFSQVYSFEVLPPRPPQVGTYFGPFITPQTGDFVKAGTVPVGLTALDVNGIQKVTLEYAAGTAAFKPVLGVTLQLVTGTITYTGNVNFTGSGILRLRAVVVDGHDISQTTYSPECTITVGQGNGSLPPYFTAAAPLLTPSTAKTRGSVKMKIKIGDDKEVREAFLHRTDVNGNYQDTVGQMIPAAKTNPAEYSCSDLNLADGLYYYRVVAQDFDGQEGISSTYGPYVLSTPQPPPPEVNIYMDVSSRFVGPTVPKETYNYPYLPYPAASLVTFNYSFNSPPGGTVTFHVYKIQEANGSGTPYNRNHSIWTGTTTKASGSLNFPAPFWTKDTKNPNAGEGTYRIVASVNGTQLGQGSGIREFTVGHAWNLPNTFTELDYGLYWFKNINNGLRCRDNQDDEYFDRSKPTVIYVHGWQPQEAGKRRRESWARQDAVTDSKFYDCCTIWKNKGYNVGVFNWNQFNDFKWGGLPDDGLKFSQAAIYKISTQPGLPAGHSLLYTLNRSKGTLAPKFEGTSQNFYLPPGQGGAIEGKTVVDLFLDELRRCMAGYTTNGDDKEFRLIGHSLGTQVVGRTAKLILDYPQWQVPRPTRIALLEIAQIVSDLNVPALQKGWLSELVANGVAFECYQSTDLQGLNGILNGVDVSEIHDMAAYAKIVPDHVPWNADLEKRNSQTHGDVVRWYMSSMGEPERPAYLYWLYSLGNFQGNPRANAGNALSARSPAWWVRGLMGQEWWFEQSGGRGTLTVSDDTFGVWDNRN